MQRRENPDVKIRKYGVKLKGKYWGRFRGETRHSRRKGVCSHRATATPSKVQFKNGVGPGNRYPDGKHPSPLVTQSPKKDPKRKRPCSTAVPTTKFPTAANPFSPWAPPSPETCSNIAPPRTPSGRSSPRHRAAPLQQSESNRHKSQPTSPENATVVRRTYCSKKQNESRTNGPDPGIGCRSRN